MVALQPPPPQIPPRVTVSDDDGLRRLQFRLRQLTLTAITVAITAWCCSLGWGPAIIALVTAKHVLVAILVMGLGVDAPRRAEA